MTEQDNSPEVSRPADEPEEKDVVRRGPISDPEQNDETTAEADDPNRFDAG
ncbi:hypothetical protein ACTXJR_07920 [Glutamicibacter ardleyensis]|uniref:hypothetical protein n=1 Tax=Glutamicibacter ardleyensis TaxID=225894 RepID=UPI003FD496BA